MARLEVPVVRHPPASARFGHEAGAGIARAASHMDESASDSQRRAPCCDSAEAKRFSSAGDGLTTMGSQHDDIPVLNAAEGPKCRQSVTTMDERVADERVTDCPLRECDGRALVTYRATASFDSSALRIITDIACNREGCENYVSSEHVASVLNSDPR
jgi:hypothetical protein